MCDVTEKYPIKTKELSNFDSEDCRQFGRALIETTRADGEPLLVFDPEIEGEEDLATLNSLSIEFSEAVNQNDETALTALEAMVLMLRYSLQKGIAATPEDVEEFFKTEGASTLGAYAEAFKEWLQNPERLEKKRPAKDSAPTFLSPSQLGIIAEAPNYDGDRSIHQSLMLKDVPGVWKTNENEGYKFCNDVVYQPKELFSEDWFYTAREDTLKELDSRLIRMRSELTADVIDILFHHWRTSPMKDKNKALITLAQICQYRGVQAEQIGNLRDAWQAMRDARAIRLTGEVDAALFEMDAMPGAQRRLWPVDEPPALDIGYVYSPGYFLAQGIAANPIYIAPYLRHVWQLRPHHDGKAKRLARYLRSEWRMNTGVYLRPKGTAPGRYRSWGNILKDAGIVPEAWEVKKPGRFIKSIDEAINTLYDIEALADVSTAIYHPEDRQLAENLPLRGALQAFQALRVCLDPAADVADALAGPHQKRVARVAENAALPKAKKSRKTRRKEA